MAGYERDDDGGVTVDDIERLLEEITNASGPTGFEGPVRAIMQRELSPICDEMETDGLGSLIGRLGEGRRQATGYDGRPHGRGGPHGPVYNGGGVRESSRPLAGGWTRP